MRRFVVSFALLAVSAPTFASDAPYCVYGSGPPQCFYYSVESCRSAARMFNGMCAPNNQPQQPQYQQPSAPQIQPIRSQVNIMDLMQHMQDAGEAGRRQGMEQQEYQARMALIRAQTEAAQRAAEPAHPYLDRTVTPWNPTGNPFLQRSQPEVTPPRFLCTDEDGHQSITSTPTVGCVVIPGE